MARRNIIAGCVLLICSLAYGFLTIQLPDRGLPNTPGPAFFPWLIAGGLTLLSATLLVKGLRGVHGPGQAAPSPVSSRGWLALGVFAVYLLLLPTLGFVTASIPFFAVLTLLYGQQNRLLVVLTAVAVPVLLFVVFRYGFQMLLPRGVWL
ncbi:MAG: tripartite tricarboxylate transporter TctB family protein [Gammaproteobacteria bacterium]|nr:tripartite tricarboxylate transporter TctB family protein [Gammaproteobacteria bacterium]MDH3506550.1 tripartite tricarboxylate transporter TctB family protein [Gammaproteobacteria bacterium]